MFYHLFKCPSARFEPSTFRSRGQTRYHSAVVAPHDFGSVTDYLRLWATVEAQDHKTELQAKMLTLCW